MGRSKLKIVRISDVKNKVFEGRKDTIMRKMQKLATLCGGVEACIIIYGPDGPSTWPEDQDEVLRIVDKYKKEGKTEDSGVHSFSTVKAKKAKVEKTKLATRPRENEEMDDDSTVNAIPLAASFPPTFYSPRMLDTQVCNTRCSSSFGITHGISQQQACNTRCSSSFGITHGISQQQAYNTRGNSTTHGINQQAYNTVGNNGSIQGINQQAYNTVGNNGSIQGINQQAYNTVGNNGSIQGINQQAYNTVGNNGSTHGIRQSNFTYEELNGESTLDVIPFNGSASTMMPYQIEYPNMQYDFTGLDNFEDFSDLGDLVDLDGV